MRDDITDILNERLDELDSLYDSDGRSIEDSIKEKIDIQNKKVFISRKKQELLKILDKLKKISPNISYDESMDVKELERIISEANI